MVPRVTDTFRNTTLTKLIGYYAFSSNQTLEERQEIIDLMREWRKEHPITSETSAENDLILASNLVHNRNNPLNLAVKSSDKILINAVIDNLQKPDSTYIEDAFLYQSTDGCASVFYIAVLYNGPEEMELILRRLIDAGQASLARKAMLLQSTSNNSAYSLLKRYIGGFMVMPREERGLLAFKTCTDTLFHRGDEGWKSILNQRSGGNERPFHIWRRSFVTNENLMNMLNEIDLSVT